MKLFHSFFHYHCPGTTATRKTNMAGASTDYQSIGDVQHCKQWTTFGCFCQQHEGAITLREFFCLWRMWQYTLKGRKNFRLSHSGSKHETEFESGGTMATVNYYYCFPSTATAAAESLSPPPTPYPRRRRRSRSHQFYCLATCEGSEPLLPTPRLPRLVWFGFVPPP